MQFYRVMVTEKFIEGNWYSAIYESGFKIIFKAEKNGSSVIFCRKDGIEVDSLPSGYLEIVNNGIAEPEYE